MVRTAPARRETRAALSPILVGLAVVTAAISGTVVYRSASSAAPSFSEVPQRTVAIAEIPGRGPDVSSSTRSSSSTTPRPPKANTTRGGVTEDDGVLPYGVTVFDERYPGVANLDPDLLRALREAATDAAHDGVELYVTSGWRSPKYQEQLLDEAISKYGSKEKAARWVGTPTTSAHVSGNAVDIGRSDAMAWLSKRGAIYGLCQIYRNEPWHYELRRTAIDHGCPPTYADPTHDPRMQQ